MPRSPQGGVRRSHLSIWIVVLVGLAAALVSVLLVGGARSASGVSELISFTRADGGIYVVRPTGGDTALLARVETQGMPRDLEWSPDGSKLAFESGDRIWVMDADGSDLTPLTGRVRRVSDLSRRVARSPSWSPDGRRIAYTLGGVPFLDEKAERDVWVMNADGRNKRRLVRTADCKEELLDWSRKSDRLVTDCGTVMNAAGGSVRSLFHGDPPIYALDWAPDGSRIVFFGFTRVGAGISVIDADSGSLVRLTERASTEPAWSLDGRRIAFARDRGRIGIFVMKPDGTGMKRLTFGHDRSPAWQLGSSG